MLELVFNSFLTLAVVDQFSLVPIFAALTRGYPEKYEAAVLGVLALDGPQVSLEL